MPITPTMKTFSSGNRLVVLLLFIPSNAARPPVAAAVEPFLEDDKLAAVVLCPML
jgi:hypothetical protein